MKTDQNLQVDELNAILTEERGKIARLIHDVGNDDSDLIKRLNDLETRVQTLEDNTVSEEVWGNLWQNKR